MSKPTILTPKQESFVLHYLDNGNASRSYMLAGYKMKNPKTINEAASRLLADSKVAARIAELRAPAVKAAQITLEQHLNDLKRLRDLAEASEKYGPAVAAEMARGKVSGLYVDKVEHSGDVHLNVSSDDARLV